MRERICFLHARVIRSLLALSNPLYTEAPRMCVCVCDVFTTSARFSPASSARDKMSKRILVWMPSTSGNIKNITFWRTSTSGNMKVYTWNVSCKSKNDIKIYNYTSNNYILSISWPTYRSCRPCCRIVHAAHKSARAARKRLLWSLRAAALQDCYWCLQSSTGCSQKNFWVLTTSALHGSKNDWIKVCIQMNETV